MEDNEQKLEISREYSTIDLGSERRPVVVSLKDRKVNVSSLKITMSRKHKTIMLLDLYTLSFVSAISVYLLMIKSWSIPALIVIGSVCFASWICALGKTICDFSSWLFTMNIMNDNMARWAIEDVIGICQDLTTAGIKVAIESVNSGLENRNEPEEQKD